MGNEKWHEWALCMLTSKSPTEFMIPYVEFPCPNCAHRLRVKYEYLGGQLRCKYCAHEFTSPSPSDEFPWVSAGRQETEEDEQAAQRRIAVLETELGSLRDELSSRTAEYTAATEKFQHAQDQLRRLQDQMHQTWTDQRNTVEFKQKLSAAQLELQSVQELLSARTAEFSTATERFQETQDELRLLQEQVHQAWTDQRNAAALNQKLTSELEELRAQALTWQERAAVERLQADRNMEGTAVEQPQTPFSSTTSASGESSTRELGAAPRSRLLEKAQSIRAQLEAGSAIKERLERLNAELEAAQVDKDRLTGELRDAIAEAAQLRAKVKEFEQTLAERTTAHADVAEAFQQGQAQWESERQALHRDWEDKHQSAIGEAEQRLEEEKTRIEADRQQLREQLDALRQEHEQGSASLRGQVEQLQQESAALRQERDACLHQVQVLGDERNRIVAERDEIDARHKEAVEGFRADMARLTQAWQESRQQEATAAEQNRALTEQLEQLRTAVEQQRGRETEHQQAAESARAEAAEEKARAEAERQKWQEQLDASQRHFDENNRSAQSEVERLREELTALQEALEIVGVVAE